MKEVNSIPEEKIISCPFCKQNSIKILHQPFISRSNLTKSRLGSGTPVYTKEKTEVLSGCDECGKSQEEIEKYLNSEKETTMEEHKKRLERFKSVGLPTMIVNERKRD